MTSKENYDLYKGYTVRQNGMVGVICGYLDSGHDMCDDQCLTAIISGDNGWSMRDPVVGYVIPDMQNHLKGYWWMHVSSIDKGSISVVETPTSVIEKYISKHFPNITDDEKDIYINVFILGTKYKES